MDNQKIASEAPKVRIVEIRLASLYYRAKINEPSSIEESTSDMKGSIGITFSGKRKYGFKVRARQEIKIGEVSFRVTHQARFLSHDPLKKDVFQYKDFRVMIMNMLMPFTSELFAVLSGKSLIIPLIAPPLLPPDEEHMEKSQD